MRLMPDFIIIGAQRCGTTALYDYLIKHPCVVSASKKEIHFFDINYGKGIAWYRAHFPSFLTKIAIGLKETCFLTGEASPYYIFHPHAPKRVARVIPRVKLMVLLRNPIDRAYSHYHHVVRQGLETFSFEDAIKKEEERLCGEMEKMLRDENYYSSRHQKYAYLSRGIYIDQLELWMALFSKEQILVIKSEDLFTESKNDFRSVLEFLDLSRWEPRVFRKLDYPSYPKMDKTMRERLIDFFRQHNERLYEFLAVDFGWDK